jgi:transposase
MKRLMITHQEITAERLREELSSSPEKRKAIRILGLLKLLEGKENIETAEFLECHRLSISDWVKKVNKDGLLGLEERPGRGVKSRLSDLRKNELKNDISRSPKEFGFKSVLWSGKILKDHIKKRYGIEYKMSAMYLIFKELGFTLQRPTRKYLGADPKKQEEFKRDLKKNHQEKH